MIPQHHLCPPAWDLQRPCGPGNLYSPTPEVQMVIIIMNKIRVMGMKLNSTMVMIRMKIILRLDPADLTCQNTRNINKFIQRPSQSG